jgi:hypothetical protein
MIISQSNFKISLGLGEQGHLMQSIRNVINSIQLKFFIIGLAMVLTGLLYPSADPSLLPSALRSMLGDLGFFLWCLSMIVAGIGMVSISQHAFIWLLPVGIFMLSALSVSFAFVSLTVSIFYLVFPASVLLTLYKNKPHQHGTRVNRFLNQIDWHTLLGLMNGAMFLIILLRPNGAGMGLFYEALDVLLYGFMSPILFLLIIYFFATIRLFFYPRPKKMELLICSLPLIIHGLTFLFVLATSDTPNWALAPMLALTPYLLIEKLGDYHYGGS